MRLSFYREPRPYREIRAVYDEPFVRVYQAFHEAIALPALEQQTFVEPFNFNRGFSWIKPSFLWTMARTNWGEYSCIEHRHNSANKTKILGIEIERTFFDSVLACAQLTHFEDDPNQDKTEWRKLLTQAKVVVQWDPEKTLTGSRRAFRAIQIGLKRPILRDYAQAIIKITDMAETIAEIQAAETEEAKIVLLPNENSYPVSDKIRKRLHMDDIYNKV